jgi:multidrug resistance efflux pump
MNTENDAGEPAGERRRGGLWYGVVMVAGGALVLLGAWRQIAHHDGTTLATVAAVAMPVLAALAARHAARKKEP